MKNLKQRIHGSKNTHDHFNSIDISFPVLLALHKHEVQQGKNYILGRGFI